MAHNWHTNGNTIHVSYYDDTTIYTDTVTGQCWHVNIIVEKDFDNRTMSLVTLVNHNVVSDVEFRIGGRGMRFNELPLHSADMMAWQYGESYVYRQLAEKVSA